MSRLVVAAAGFAICGMLAAADADAGFPDPANSDCPGPAILIVGQNGAVADPLGEYCVTIRDFTNTPVENALVTINFSNCGDIQLCTDQLDPAITVDCIAQTLNRHTDAAGRACFRVIGTRRDFDCATKSSSCVEVFWDGTFICALYAPVFDLVPEAGPGLTGADLSRFLHLFLDCGVYLTAIDYNHNGVSDGDDLSQWLTAFFRAGSSVACPPAARCP